MVNQVNYSNTKNTSVKFQFMADVELGVPSRQCRNFGICRVHPIGGANLENRQLEVLNKKCTKRNPIGGVVSVMESGNVEICFLKHHIDEMSYHKYFISGKFKVEEDFYFSKSANSEEEFTIKKGSYPLTIGKTLITILFTV